MKDKIIGIINLANSIEVKGGENILNLYKIIAISQAILNEIEKYEQEKQEQKNEES